MRSLYDIPCDVLKEVMVYLCVEDIGCLDTASASRYGRSILLDSINAAKSNFTLSLKRSQKHTKIIFIKWAIGRNIQFSDFRLCEAHEKIHFGAIASDDVDIVKFFLKYKFPVNGTPISGLTSLQAAVGYNAFNVTALLLQQGADINLVSFHRSWCQIAPDLNCSALACAILGLDHADMISYLLSHGADTNVCVRPPFANHTTTAVQLCAKAGKLDYLRLFVAHGCQPDHVALMHAVHGSHFMEFQ
jgi:ankyrin repeat protein